MKTVRCAAFAVVAALQCGTASVQPPDWTGRYTELRGKSLNNLKQVRLDGKYLEYKVTVEDPKNLTEPATYTRYYESSKRRFRKTCARTTNEPKNFY